MKGILYRAELLPKVMDGTKTVTRRLDGLKEINKEPDRWELIPISKGSPTSYYPIWNRGTDEVRIIRPRYHPGEVVYMKETYQTYRKDSQEESEAKQTAIANIKNIDDLLKFVSLPYGHGELAILYAADFGKWAFDVDSGLKPWRSPLFMPAWAARTFLEILSVRPELFLDDEFTFEELDHEGGEASLKYLQEYDGKWLWCIEFRKTARPEVI